MQFNLRTAMWAVTGALMASLPMVVEAAPPAQQPTPARKPQVEIPPPPESQYADEAAPPRRGRRERVFGLERGSRFRALNQHERDHESVRIAFREVVNEPHKATVRVMCDDRPSALGIIVDTEGYILTKASELHGRLTVKLHDKRLFDAQLIGSDRKTDLAMLKIEADNLTAATWRDAQDVPAVGSLLASAGLETLPLAIGVVSVQPRLIAAPSGVLGVVLEDSDAAPQVREIMTGSGAQKAGLKPGDQILALNGEKMRDRQQLVETIRQFQPGDKLALEIKRGSEQLEVQATLGERPTSPDGDRRDFQNMLGGPLSERRTGFPLALQHDTVLMPQECGGPLVDLDGRCVGINIARAGRVNSYALPASVVLPLVAEFKAGKFSPSPAPKSDKIELTTAQTPADASPAGESQTAE